MTKGEEAFVDQMTRKKLVEWCDQQITQGSVTVPNDAYMQKAFDKRWISTISTNSDNTYKIKILSAGWDTASRFLKR